VSVLLCNGVRLGFDEAGVGQPLILVHGSWTNRLTWDSVFLKLAEHFRVIRYDRRGYGESDKPGAPPSVHADDLRALIDALGLTTVALVGNSMGALIALQVASALPNCELSFVLAHEPPLLWLLDEAPPQTVLSERIRSALVQAASAGRDGDWEGCARYYVEGSSGAPGVWEYLPAEQKRAFIENAPAFLDDASDPTWWTLEPPALRALESRVVVTSGSVSSPFLRIISERLSALLPQAQRRVFPHAGHVAHQTAPQDFVDEIVKQYRPTPRLNT